MTDLDLAYTPATELARRIRARALSPVEVVSNSLARIAEVNPTLNCFCFVYPDEAMAKAREAEQAVMAGKPLGPLHGVPIAIKDLTPTRDKRTTLGSYAYEDWVPEADAPIVEALLGAGAILVGKTTTPEFAYSGFTESPLWGITRNPWNSERTPGGSSGGSGAAVASGCVPLAEGSDMGGSVRIPAALCGIVGLKPSFGRIPFTILPSQFDQLSHFGPLSRTVADTALFLKVTQGPDERDIQSLKPALDIPIPPPHSVDGLKLALSPDLGFYALHPEVEANMRHAAAVLADLGATVEEVELRWTKEMVDVWTAHWGVYLATFFGDKLPEWRHKMDPNVVALIEAGLAMDAVSFKRLEFLRTEQWKALAPILERYDALLCPTMAQPAPPVGGRDENYDRVDEAGRYHGFDITSIFNLVSQCPALSVPSGFTGDGLPTALQIVGRRFDDLTALRIGAALETARPWTGKRPPV
ncbi:amidase [Rhodospirillaceae bacterium SYSU D60014]|uniref:amidase n=1 Tax=Virgifigura deserti TaxID=2268457 RepID=UPI000E676486